MVTLAILAATPVPPRWPSVAGNPEGGGRWLGSALLLSQALLVVSLFQGSGLLPVFICYTKDGRGLGVLVCGYTMALHREF